MGLHDPFGVRPDLGRIEQRARLHAFLELLQLLEHPSHRTLSHRLLLQAPFIGIDDEYPYPLFP
jgi:hypothetical protein